MYISLIAGVLEIDIEPINSNKRISNKEGVQNQCYNCKDTSLNAHRGNFKIPVVQVR